MSDLTEHIADLTVQIRSLSDQRTRLLQDWARDVSPWKVGEVTAVQGFSFNGKQCRVRTVTGRLNYQQQPEIRVTATVLKQDGSDSKNIADWTWRAPSPLSPS